MGVGWDSFATPKGSTGHNRSITFDKVGGNHNPSNPQDAVRTLRSEGAKFRAFLCEVMTEALRVLRPGGHALIWALPRTSHWTATALEDAGFEVRDKLYHLFGSGFPKSLDIGKAIDRMAPRQGMFTAFAQHFNARWMESKLKRSDFVQYFSHYKNAESIMAQLSNWKLAKNVPTKQDFEILKGLIGLSDEWTPLIEREEAEREVIGKGYRIRKESIVQIAGPSDGEYDITAPATPEAQRWQGYGTALKPSCEEWILCRKPLAESSIAAQVLATGTGGLNIDQCRVGYASENDKEQALSGDAFKRKDISDTKAWARPWMQDQERVDQINREAKERAQQGRFPSHLLLSHSLWCVPRGTKRVWGTHGNGTPIHSNGMTTHGWGHKEHRSYDYTDSEGMETVEAYDCAPDCPIAELDRQSGVRAPGYRKNPSTASGAFFGSIGEHVYGERGYDDQGGASRYFQHFPPDDYTPYLYQSKASRAERNRGCEDLPSVTPDKLANSGLKNVIRRCPEHDASLPSGVNAYACGCQVVFETEGGANRRMSTTQNTHPT